MNYYCSFCEYETNNSGNFSHHKKSQKHIKLSTKKDALITNLQNKTTDITKVYNDSSKSICSKITIPNFLCKTCNFSTKHKSSYYRHIKNCDKTESILELKLKLEFEKEKAELYKKIENEKDNLLKEKSEMLNTFMANANNLLNKTVDNNKVTAEAMKSVSMSALKYANEKFKNTPALLPLDNFNLNDLDFDDEEDKKKLVEILIYNAKQNSLDKLLGDHIVKEYKKENPEEQPFHTTDCSRLNYIVRELIETALIWSTDKSGIKICTSIIKPLIKKCINALLEHQKYLLQEMSRGEYHVQKDVEIIINVLMTIESGNLETEINKYIAPYFNLERK